MKIIKKDDNTYNIEGLTDLELAILYEGIWEYHWNNGDYKPMHDKRTELINGFELMNINELYDLKAERKKIEVGIDEIMNKYAKKSS